MRVAPENDDEEAFSEGNAEATAEISLIGAMLLHPEEIDAFRESLRAEHFSDERCAWLYGVILDWQAAGTPITPPMLIAKYNETMRDAGLREAINDALTYSAFFGTATQIASNIRTRGDLRIMQAALGKLSVARFDNPRLLASEVERVVGAHAIAADDRDYSHSAGESASAVIERAKAAAAGAPLGVECYFLPEIEPMAPTDLVILAGRPAMGKSALAGNIARATSEQGTGTIFFSLEMSHDQVVARMMAEMTRESEAPCSAEEIKRGKLSKTQFEMLAKCQAALARRPLFIHDRGGQSMGQIRHWTRTYKAALEARGVKLGLVIVDYLQLVVNPKSKGDRVGDVTQISGALKALAKEFRVPVLALSQLTRQCEQRDDKRPQLSDLRDSGSIEQDADTVMFVYRDEYYHMKTRPKPGQEIEWETRKAQVAGKAELIRAKNRHGRVGTDDLYWDGEHQAFRSPSLKTWGAR